MARKTKQERWDDVYSEARKEFDNIQSALYDERKQNLNDRRFCSIAGAQWEGPWGDQWENKPKLEVNKIQLSLVRIYIEYRNNRITVDFEPTDGSGSDALSDTCDDLYRATERRSVATEAYDNAFDEGTTGGIGAWRLTTEYENEYEEDDKKKHQRILIEPIYDADTSVFFNLDAKKQDKSDATRGYIIHSYHQETYDTRWPDHKVASWPKQTESNNFDWNNDKIIYVAEYYEVEDVRDTQYEYKTITDEEGIILKSEIDEEELEEGELSMVEEVEAKGGVFVSERKIRKKRVHKYFMSGGGILEDHGIIAGDSIPIVIFFGKRFVINNIERAIGQVRLPKDMQRLENTQASKLAEIAALGSVPKPIVTPHQMAGHQKFWEEDNVENYAYLTLNPMVDKDGNELPAGPLGYTQPAQIPPALGALLQYTDNNIKGLLGNPEQGERIVSNISNEAIESVQDQLQMQTFIYMDNFAKSIKRSGEIWLGIAKEIYTESISKGRKVKGITNQGKSRQIELLRSVQDEDGKTVLENDFSKADMELVVNVGPTTSTKRKATVRTLTKLLPMVQDPATASVIISTVMMNIEGEGLEDVREWSRDKLVAAGVVKPTDEEAKELAAAAQNQPQSAQDNLANALAEKESNLAGKAVADTEQSQAKTQNLNADTAEKLSGIERDDRGQLIDTVEKLNQ